MNFEKVLLYIGIICILIPIFIIIIINIILLKNVKIEYDYDLARKETIDFLDKNIGKLEETSKKCLLEKDREEHNFMNKEYHYVEHNNRNYVLIYIDGQSMLGGQYWFLIYCENDYLYGNNINIYDEYKENGKGNNIFITEKIRDNWYFYYQDWDGKVDITKFKNSKSIKLEELWKS